MRGFLLTEELADLYSSLGTLLDRGRPLSDTLAALADAYGETSFGAVVRELAARIESGVRLHTAMSENPAIFPVNHIQIIATAESDDRLPQTLCNLAAIAQYRPRVLRRSRKAVVAPALCLAVVCLVCWLSFTVIMPCAHRILREMLGDEHLPLLTRFFIRSSEVFEPLGLQPVGFAVLLTAVSVWMWIGLPGSMGAARILMSFRPILRLSVARADFALLCTIISNRLSADSERPCILPTDETLFLTPEIREGIIRWSEYTGAPLRGIHESERGGAVQFEQLLALVTRGSENKQEAIIGIDGLAKSCLEQVHAWGRDEMGILPVLVLAFYSLIIGAAVLALFMPLLSWI